MSGDGREATTADGVSAGATGSHLHPPGTQVDRYVILSSLGEGAMGAVYAAYDAVLERRVALKFLVPRFAEGVDESEGQARLLLEAKAMARLSHPNVVTLYEVGPAPSGGIYLAMELVEGGTLGAWLKGETGGWRKVLELLCQAGEGLAAAHRAGMIHRDFKLDNVLVRKDGRPQVTDFGVVRAAGDDESQTASRLSSRSRTAVMSAEEKAPSPPFVSSSTLSSLTLTGSMLGTPGYMAPEQYGTDEPIDARTDIFAFSVTLYRALYRKRPFEGASMEEIAEATLLGKVREPPAGSDVPGWVRKAVLWGMKTDPKERPASMDVLLAALRADPAKKRQMWLIGSLLFATVPAIALGVRAEGVRREKGCQVAESRLGGAWNEARKVSLAKAFHATGRSYADDTWQRVAIRVDAYAASWAAAGYEACAATRVRGEQSPAMMQLRTECLDDRLDAISAMTRVFENADEQTVLNAVKVASTLPSIEACGNLDKLSAATRLPDSAAARAEVRALQGELVLANDLRLSGKETESRARLEQLEGRVKAASYGPVLVAWTMATAQLDVLRDAKKSLEEWKNALVLADTYHLDRERAESAVNLGVVHQSLQKYSDAEWWFTAASATLNRIGGDLPLERKRDESEALNQLMEAHPEVAIRILSRSLERMAAAHAEDPIDLARTHSMFGMALAADETRLAEAVAHAHTALSLSETALGPSHPVVAGLLVNLSQIQMAASLYDEALASVSRGIGSFLQATSRGELPENDSQLGAALCSKGELLLRLGRASEALEPLEKGRAISRAAGRADYLVASSIDLAEALRRTGRIADATKVCREARSMADAEKETRSDVLIILLAEEASLLLDQGKPQRALPLAERAVDLAGRDGEDTYDLATTRLVLARALVRGRGDAVRARALVEQAAAGFARRGDHFHEREASALIR